MKAAESRGEGGRGEEVSRPPPGHPNSRQIPNMCYLSMYKVHTIVSYHAEWMGVTSVWLRGFY